MKNLTITKIEKDYASLTPTGDYKLRIHFEVTGTNFSPESKVMFTGLCRKDGREESIFSEKLNLGDSEMAVTEIPAGNDRIPKDSEVAIWGMVDTDYETYKTY